MADPAYSTTGPAAPSRFVTGVAWIFIVISGFSVAIALGQALALLFWPPLVDVIDQYQATAAQQGEAATLAAFVLDNLAWMTLSNLFVSMLVLIAAIGLLKRFNWARLMFIVILGLMILWAIGSIFMLWQTAPFDAPAAAAAYQPVFRGPSMSSLLFGTVFALLICLLIGWVIRRLCSAPIRAEFH